MSTSEQVAELNTWAKEHREVALAVVNVMTNHNCYTLTSLGEAEPDVISELHEAMTTMLAELPVEKLAWE